MDMSLLAFLGATILLNIIPGPDMLFILSKTFSNGAKSGLIATAGISSGLLIHTLFAATGLSLIILNSAFAFELVKWMGCGYLIFIGAKMLLQKSPTSLDVEQDKTLNADRFKIYKQAFLVNVLNPKVAIFFIAFLPQFINKQSDNLAAQFFILGLLFIISGTLINLLVVILGLRIKLFISCHPRFIALQEKISGLMFIAIGVSIFKLQR